MIRLHIVKSILVLVFFLLISPPFVVAATAPTKIVTSIKPLELLVKAVADDSVEVTTLVPAGASPHTYTMRPSQRRALEEAEVIFWVGPKMENFLTRLLGGADFRGRTVQLMDGENQEHHDDGTHHSESETASHDHDHDHSHEGEDPHVWVSPDQALIMAQKIHDTLAQLEGADKQVLTRNLEQFEQNLKQTDSQIRAMLKPASDISLFAYHTAFTGFAEHYDLNLKGVLTLNPELTPGARHIAEVQESLRKADHSCLLTEPQFNRQWWQSITRGLNVTFSTWDPLATDIVANADGYTEFQLSIAKAVLRCLPERHST